MPTIPGPRDVLSFVSRGGESLEQLAAAVPRVLALLERAEQAVEQVEQLLTRIEATRAIADDVVRRTGETQAAAQRMLEQLEPPLTSLQPTLERLAESTDPREVDALVAMIDHFPLLAQRLETDLIPIVHSMGSVAPDLHDLLDTTREVNQLLGKIPGMGRIKKRVEESQEEQS